MSAIKPQQDAVTQLKKLLLSEEDDGDRYQAIIAGNAILASWPEMPTEWLERFGAAQSRED